MIERPRISDPEALPADARMHYECMVAFEFDLDEIDKQIDALGANASAPLLSERAKIEGWINYERGELAKLVSTSAT